jgi:hypothetical protein
MLTRRALLGLSLPLLIPFQSAPKKRRPLVPSTTLAPSTALLPRG